MADLDFQPKRACVLRRYVFFHPAWEHAAFAHAKKPSIHVHN